MIDESGELDLELAVAVAWGLRSSTTDDELQQHTSRLLASLTALRDHLPDAPLPDMLKVDAGLTDKAVWRRQGTLHRDGARAATDLVLGISTRPGEWPETMQRIVSSHTRRHGRPVLGTMADSLTRLAATGLGVIARESGQPLPELLDDSLPWLRR